MSGLFFVLFAVCCYAFADQRITSSDNANRYLLMDDLAKIENSISKLTFQIERTVEEWENNGQYNRTSV